ncbi:MAG: cytochrome C [Gemmatimonadota bacterium]|jgi:virginiamycin B lyase
MRNRRPWLSPLTALPALLSVSLVFALAMPAPAQAQRRPQTPVVLPDGPGKEIVQTTCVGCHDLRRVTGDGYTREGWVHVFTTMVDLPPEQVSRVADYLAKNFPEKPKPHPVLLPGDATVSFREWPLPTKGSRPHDPLATPDGAIWYTGMFSNKLGRVDPQTGQIREYPLKTEGSGPHGLTVDGAGHIWFTANRKAYIGELDPKTGAITEYRVDARDPHTPLFDRKGMLWFTAQGANKVGRLDPKTGKAELITLPTRRSNPYGLVISSTGVPFFAEFGGNRIGRIDPATMKLTEYDLPHDDARPRRIAIDGDDVLWYTDYARGYVGRFDPKAGTFDEWPSPSGAQSRPYGIAYTRGAVWYVETGVTPNALVRFDPTTERFQSWVIPGGGGVVRNMMPDRDGNLVIAESGLNKVGLVTIGR